MSRRAVHGMRIIRLVTSYCNFIVPARSAAAYIHCMHPNTMMFISFGGIRDAPFVWLVFRNGRSIYSLTSDALLTKPLRGKNQEIRNNITDGGTIVKDLSVFISGDSFVNLVSAVAEGFKSEVGGVLFGDLYKRSSKVVIRHAIPLQTTKRKPSEVHYHHRRTKRVKGMWDELTPYWYIGCFHSHPEYGKKRYSPDPSEEDIKSMKADDIDLIVSIYTASRRGKLGYVRRLKRISGAVGKYHVEVAAWHCVGRKDVREIEIWCPYIEIINLSYELGIVRHPGQLFGKDSIVPIRLLRTLGRLARNYENQVFRSPDQYYSGLRPIKKKLKGIKRWIDRNN